MAAVVVRVEFQELLVDLVEEPGKTTPSMLSAMEQAGRGAQVAPDLHSNLRLHKEKVAPHGSTVLQNHTIGHFKLSPCSAHAGRNVWLCVLNAWCA